MLTLRQRGFVRDYLLTKNGTLAAKRNYNVTTENSAAAVAVRQLRSIQVQQAIKEEQEPILQKYRRELNAIVKAMELKNKDKEDYKTLVEATDKMQKQVQLLSGGATENTASIIKFDSVFDDSTPGTA